MCGYIKHGSFRPFFLRAGVTFLYANTHAHTQTHTLFLKIKHLKYVNHEENSKICVNKWINPLYTKIFTNCRTLINCVFFFFFFIIKQIWRLYQKLCKKIRDFSVCFSPCSGDNTSCRYYPFLPSWSLCLGLPCSGGWPLRCEYVSHPLRVRLPHRLVTYKNNYRCPKIDV